MLGRLFLLFTVIPLLELWLLMYVSDAVGLSATIAMVLSTGMLGAALARREGTRAISSWQESLARGETPKEGIASGLLILVGGIFLVTPGVLTDVAGLALLLPPLRRVLANMLVNRVGNKLHVQQIHPISFESARDPQQGADEFIDVDGHFHATPDEDHQATSQSLQPATRAEP